MSKKNKIKKISKYSDIKTKLDAIDFLITNSDISSYRNSKEIASKKIADIIIMRFKGLSINEMAELTHNESTGGLGVSPDRVKQFIAKAARELYLKIEGGNEDLDELCPFWQIKKLSAICKSIAVN